MNESITPNYIAGLCSHCETTLSIGNWNSVTTDGGSPETRTHNRQNEITAVSGATTPTYDANGNMTRDETGKLYSYDPWNRLLRVREVGGSPILAEYNYDALGRRAIDDGVARIYSANWQVLEERSGTQTTNRYIWSPVYVDAMVARDRDTDANGTLDERLYPTHDANFNVTALLNTYGAVVERMTYDPFGKLEVRDAAWALETGSSVAWIHLHQGGRLDVLTGLYHFRNREYSPTLGRWVTMDPIRFATGDSNLYVYVSNNPIRALDPAGLATATYAVRSGKVEIETGNNTIRFAYIGTATNLRVKQWVQIEVYGRYRCPGRDERGPCFTESDWTLLRPGVNLDPSGRNTELPHDHEHQSASPFDPKLQIDHGGSQDGFSKGEYLKSPDGTLVYSDTPTTAEAVHATAAKSLPKTIINPTPGFAPCTLAHVRVVQRFVTIVYLGLDGNSGLTPVLTVHWTSTTEGPPGRPSDPVTTLISANRGELEPTQVIKDWKAEEINNR